jgi:hypothetical protein
MHGTKFEIMIKLEIAKALGHEFHVQLLATVDEAAAAR